MLKHGLFVFGLATALSAFFLPIENPDLHWHLSAARYIVTHHRLPAADFLSWTAFGKPWVDFEWLPQLAYYDLYCAGGFAALLAFKILILSAALAVFYMLVRLYAMENLFFLAAPVWAAGLIPSLDLRPENFTLLLFSAELYWLEKFRLGKSSWRFPKLALYCAAFFALWANLHAGFLYGLALLGMYSFGEFVPAALPYVYGRGKNIPFKNALLLAGALAAGTAGSLLNAYGWEIYSVALQHRDAIGKLQEYIVEWQPSSLLNPYQWPYWGITLLAFLVLLTRFIKKRDISYAHLAAIFYFGLSSSSHSRHSLFMVLTAIPCTLYMLRGIDWKGWRRHAATAACALLFMLTLSHFYDFVWTRGAGPAWRGAYAPEGAALFLKHNSGELRGLRMYNSWSMGGYLGYELYPDYRIFVDGRYIFHNYLEEMQSATKDNRAWETFVKKYGFDIVVMMRASYKFPLQKTFKTGRKEIVWRPFYLLFNPKDQWAVAYWDRKSVVLVRRKAVSGKWLKEHEFSYVRADDLPAVSVMVLEGELSETKVKKEVFSYLRGPHGSGADDAGPEVLGWWRRLQELIKEKRTTGQKIKPLAKKYFQPDSLVQSQNRAFSIQRINVR